MKDGLKDKRYIIQRLLLFKISRISNDFKTSINGMTIHDSSCKKGKTSLGQLQNKTPYEIFRKFDEKADDGYFLGYSLVSKAFRVFNTRRQQTKETYHITSDERPDAMKFSKPSVDNINITESERYPLDVINKDVIILYSLTNVVNIDYANIFWEDIIIKLNKKTKEKVVSYCRFLSLLIQHKKNEPAYEDSDVTINPTQVFNKHVVFKAPKTSSKAEKKDSKGKKPGAKTGSNKIQTGSNSKGTKDGSFKALGVTSEGGAHTQLSSGRVASSDFTAEADIGKSAPHDTIPRQQDKTKSVSERLEAVLTTSETGKGAKDDSIIMVDENEEEEEHKDEGIHANSNVETKDTSIPKHPSPRCRGRKRKNTQRYGA
uniref:Retrovirus-related Pol polyprotein from transposon TNT 1-94 n=1 Tax=Tanacetum cinerariifolium TaxID=118510 RepID=A0A6L2KG83_TANCI|nr:retrovirus-related Pol polyprotein from transposon TNT 1-94 [Tanacetum cinerariifolium]